MRVITPKINVNLLSNKCIGFCIKFNGFLLPMQRFIAKAFSSFVHITFVLRKYMPYLELTLFYIACRCGYMRIFCYVNRLRPAFTTITFEFMNVLSHFALKITLISQNCNGSRIYLCIVQIDQKIFHSDCVSFVLVILIKFQRTDLKLV